ncbi:MAG: HD domain-containing protein [Candidatus Woesearchaeota archaeon]
MEELEAEVEKAFKELGTEAEKMKPIEALLGIIKNKDPETAYPHSLRVGLMGYKVAKFMHLDMEVLFYAGLLHDIGKFGVSSEILKKTEGFNDEDMKEMEIHPLLSYNIVKDIDPFIAEIILRHHRFQGKKSYPKNLPRPKLAVEFGSEDMVEFYAGILAFLDQYDASKRENDKHGEDKKPLTREEVINGFIKENKGMRRLVTEIYRKGILGDVASDSGMSDKTRELIKKHWTGVRNPEETRCLTKIACTLRPTHFNGKKKEEFDKSYHERFNVFIGDKLKLGKAFEEYAKKLVDERKQPGTIYGTAYAMLEEFKEIKKLWRANHGLIELLLPISSAELLYDKFNMLSLSKVLEKATEVMKGTSEDDVVQLTAMRRIAYDLDGKEKKEVPKYDVKNVYDYYAEDMGKNSSLSSKTLSEELVNNFPTVMRVYEEILKSEKELIKDKVENAYALLLGDRPKMPSFKADCAAAAAYLILSHHKF